MQWIYGSEYAGTGGRESLMATYEFYVESMNGNELTLSFVGGRPEVDAGISGQCKVVYKDDKLSFPDLIKAEKMLPLMD